MDRKTPFLGVPKGDVYVENPDGCYRGGPDNHSLYDTKPPLAQPTVPGNYDVERTVHPRRE